MDTFLNWLDEDWVDRDWYKSKGIDVRNILEFPENPIDLPMMKIKDGITFHHKGKNYPLPIVRSDIWIDLDQEDPEYQKPIQHLYF